jgi:hypothetical protein
MFVHYSRTYLTATLMLPLLLCHVVVPLLRAESLPRPKESENRRI